MGEALRASGRLTHGQRADVAATEPKPDADCLAPADATRPPPPSNRSPNEKRAHAHRMHPLLQQRALRRHARPAYADGLRGIPNPPSSAAT